VLAADRLFVIPRDGGYRIERPSGRSHEREAQPSIEDGSQIDAGKAVAFDPFASRETDDRGELTLTSKGREVTLSRSTALIGGTDGGRRGINFPHRPASVKSEVRPDRARVGVAAGADK
jgi:hypothetical protein